MAYTMEKGNGGMEEIGKDKKEKGNYYMLHVQDLSSNINVLIR